MASSGTVEKPRIGISACLNGADVRYNGGHCRGPHILDELRPHVEYVPVCPEVEAGLGAPRESLRLSGVPGGARLVGNKSGTDRTPLLKAWSRARLTALSKSDLHGFILKKGSPSCGLSRVRVYRPTGIPMSDGAGVFAESLQSAMPLLPVQEEGRLTHPGTREHFVTRVFARWRWSRLLAADPAPRDLGAFHGEHKMLVLAHDPARYRRLGRIVGEHAGRPFDEALEDYGVEFAKALAEPPTRGRHVNVLQHLLGFTDVDREARAALTESIEEYRRGEVPLIVPERLIRHHVRAASEWASAQRYFDPFPHELHLRTEIVPP